MEYLAYTYNNLGIVYEKIEKYNDSIEIMTAARDVFKELSKSKPEPHERYLSACLNNLGISYTKLSCFDKAEEVFKEAIAIRKKWADYNPNEHEPWLAECYNSIGTYYFEADRYKDSEENYNNSLEIYARLAGRTPDAFEPPLADCKVNLAELLAKTERFSEAETALKDAIALYEKYASANLAYAKKAASARGKLDRIMTALNNKGGPYSSLSPEEKDVAALLTDGLTRREIIRKLKINAEDYERHEKAIKQKLNLIGESDSIITDAALAYGLTKRESDILRCLGRRMDVNEIAAELFLSEITVRGHLRNLLKKLPEDRRENIPEWCCIE